MEKVKEKTVNVIIESLEISTKNPVPLIPNNVSIMTMLGSIQNGQEKQSEDIKSLQECFRDIEEY